MATVTLRGLSASTVEDLKQEARRAGVSLNRLLVQRLEKQRFRSTLRPRDYDDLDHLFGTLDEEEYQRITEAVAEQRRIDPELWGQNS
jgi:ABC-type uncharacterized transport system substrate-binding protein